jgi:hypothetical protein
MYRGQQGDPQPQQGEVASSDIEVMSWASSFNLGLSC